MVVVVKKPLAIFTSKAQNITSYVIYPIRRNSYAIHTWWRSYGISRTKKL